MRTMNHVCSRCGTAYPGEYLEQWGQNGIGDGHGERPVCSALLYGEQVEVDFGSRIGKRVDVPSFVCKGELVPVPTIDRDEAVEGVHAARFSHPFTLNIDGQPEEVSPVSEKIDGRRNGSG